jgi:uncharacterized integral membrane protein
MKGRNKMKNVKIAFWVILFAIIGLILYQNRDFYMTQHSLGIDLMFFNYRTPEVPNAILFLGFFFTGLIISYFFSLLERFNSRKTIKNLSESLRASEKMLDALKAENEGLKGVKEDVPAAPEESSKEDEQKDTDAS